jgi:hypothetical protein
MALYQSQKGIVAYIKLAVLCVKLRQKIFYTKVENDFIAILRAVYFPISCVDYIRYMSKRNKWQLLDIGFMKTYKICYLLYCFQDTLYRKTL